MAKAISFSLYLQYTVFFTEKKIEIKTSLLLHYIIIYYNTKCNQDFSRKGATKNNDTEFQE